MPRTVDSPYHSLNALGPINYQESLSNYQTYASYSQIPTVSPPRMQTAHEAPWTSLEQRVPRYPGGYVAFALSPEPNGEFFADYRTSVPPSPEASEASQSREKRSRKAKSSSTQGKGKEPGWEHVVVAKGGWYTMSEIPEEESRRSGGCRTGKLDPKTKEKAHRIRKIKACWPCYIAKVPVSFPLPRNISSANQLDSARRESLARGV